MAYLIRRDPTKLRVFLDDNGRPAQRKAARKSFTSSNLFPASEPALAALGEEYDIASHRAHSNVVSFIFHLARSDNPGMSQLSIQDLPETSIPTLLPLHVLWLANAHLAILDSVLVTFSDVRETPELLKFKEELGYLGAKIARFKTKLDEASQLA